MFLVVGISGGEVSDYHPIATYLWAELSTQRWCLACVLF